LPSASLLVGLAVVARDFGMSQGETAWISTAITLSSGSFLLLGGRLADLYGRKLVLVSSFTLSAVWSLIAGFAQSKFLTLNPLIFTNVQDIYFLWHEGCKD
jgi:MFS family permease